MFRENLQHLCPIASGPVTGRNWKDLDSVFKHSLDQIVFVVEVLIKFPWDFSSLTWTGQPLSAFPYGREASVPLPSSCFHWPVYSMSMPCTEEPRTGHNTLAVSSVGLSRGGGSPALTCCPQSFALAQDTVNLFCCKGALLAYSHVGAYFSAKLFSKWLVFNIYWCTSWPLWGSCQAISSGCWGLSGGQHDPLAYQPLLPVLCHLQICRRNTLLCHSNC